MVKYRSATCYLALTVLGCMIGTLVEAQFTKDWQKPSNPQLPSYPQRQQTPTKPQQPWNPPNPQRPQTPMNPQRPQTPMNPQRPQTPMNPQRPQTPTKPQHPWAPSNPQRPQTPTKPQLPKDPTYPQRPQFQKEPKQQSGNWYSDHPELEHPEVVLQVNPAEELQEPRQLPQAPEEAPNVAEVEEVENVPVDDFNQKMSKGYSPQMTKRPPPPPPLICEIPEGQRIRCGHPDTTPTGCEILGCCFGGNMCYYGKAVTVQCTKEGEFIVVVARDATLPNIDLDSLSLLNQGPGCSYTDSNSGFVIYQFRVTACGTIVREEPGAIIYGNMIVSAYEVDAGPYGFITRDSSLQLVIECRYSSLSSALLTVDVQLVESPPPALGFGPTRVEMRLGSGKCTTKGCYEADVAYTSYFMAADYPVTKVLREEVYVEIRLLEKTDPSLVLTLDNCWTTTSLNPHDLPRWDILTNGCPYPNDNYMSALLPVTGDVVNPTHYKRFLFKMFAFVEPQHVNVMNAMVYLHCSTALCTPTQGYSCEPACHRKQRDVSGVANWNTDPKVVVSSGALLMTSPVE